MEFKRSSSGITLIALIITIIVLLIIAGITVYSGASIIKEAQTQDIKTNMLLIQANAKVKLEDKKFDDSVELIGSKEMPTDLRNSSGENLEDYYCLSEEDLAQMNINSKTLAHGTYYLVKYDMENLDVEVLYTGGVENSSGKTFYKLSEMQ